MKESTKALSCSPQWLPYCMVALLLCSAPLARAQNVEAPDLINPSLDDDVYELWNDINNALFQALVSAGPPTCNAIARVWWRAFFHDFGTYNKTDNTGGCDGSIKFELDRPENSASSLIPETIHFYEGLQRDFSSRGQVSMADIVILAGYVSVAACNGPHMMFTPGRKDAPRANRQGLLPARADSTDVIVASFARMALSNVETVAIVGAGHTIANLALQLDSTPAAFDNIYFQQLLTSTAPAVLPADRNMLGNDAMRSWAAKFAGDQQFFFNAVARTCFKMSWLGHQNSKNPVVPELPRDESGRANTRTEVTVIQKRENEWEFSATLAEKNSGFTEADVQKLFDELLREIMMDNRFKKRKA